jgi:hypothetical protein
LTRTASLRHSLRPFSAARTQGRLVRGEFSSHDFFPTFSLYFGESNVYLLKVKIERARM